MLHFVSSWKEEKSWLSPAIEFDFNPTRRTIFVNNKERSGVSCAQIHIHNSPLARDAHYCTTFLKSELKICDF